MRAKDFYEVLGVDRTASGQEIRAAYRRLVRELHPDGGGGPSDQDRERLREVMDAYAVLGRDDRRAAYDAALRRAETALWAQPPPRRPVWLAGTRLDGRFDEEDLLRILYYWFR
jgi:DnaJ-class molecular chaperone